MKKRLVRMVLSMALSFTVVTSFMVSAVQINAQEAAVQSHTHILREYHNVYCEEANSEYHFVFDEEIQYCIEKECDYSIRVSHKQIGYEKHESWGVAQAPFRWYCLDCGYAE